MSVAWHLRKGRSNPFTFSFVSTGAADANVQAQLLHADVDKFNIIQCLAIGKQE